MYISKINDFKENCEDILLEVTVKDIKKYQFNHGAIIFLKLEDKTSSLYGFTQIKKDKLEEFDKMIKINNKYIVNGDILIFNDELIKELDESELELFTNLNIKTNDLVLGIKKIIIG